MTASDVTSEFTNQHKLFHVMFKKIFSVTSLFKSSKIQRELSLFIYSFKITPVIIITNSKVPLLVINLIKSKIAGRCGTRNLPTGNL